MHSSFLLNIDIYHSVFSVTWDENRWFLGVYIGVKCFY